MKKNVPWNLIIPKLKQEISIDEELQLKTWLLNSNNEALFKELQQLWEKIQTNGENYTPDTEFYWKCQLPFFVCFPLSRTVCN